VKLLELPVQKLEYLKDRINEIETNSKTKISDVYAQV
jgi:hypothetical protein